MKGEKQMNLGIIAPAKESSFKMAADKGLDFLEFCINVGDNTDTFFKDLEQVKKWIEQYHVSVGSIGRWGTDKLDQDGNVIKQELDISYKLIDAACFLGCRNFVCGCNYVEALSYYENCTAAINYLSTLIEYGKKQGIKISTYNCRWNNYINNPQVWTIIHGHLQELGIKFDPSHSYYAGMDYLKEIRDWGDRVYHVHIKGAMLIDGERFDDPPAGLDRISWEPLMAVLYQKQYKEGLSIEPHSKTWRDELGEKGVDFTIQYMRKLLFYTEK